MNLLLNGIVLLLLIRISYLDIKERVLPNKYIFFFIIISLLYESKIIYGQRILETVIIIIPLLLVWLWLKAGIGAGDIKLIGVLILIYSLEIALYGILLGLVAAILWNIISKKETKNIPLVPFISCGILFTVIL